MERDPDFMRYLETLSPKVQKHTTIVDSAEQPQPFMLHISKDSTGKPYIPRIGQRQGASEDRTTPRITCADTLLGCIIGYADAIREFLDCWSHPEIRKNGFRINRLDYTHCLKPDGFLVYDSRATNEHWLLSYNRDTAVYKPKTAGRMYLRSITSRYNPKNHDLDHHTMVFLEVVEKEGIFITSTLRADPGYYQLQFLYNRNTVFNSEKELTLKRITRDVFMKQETTTPVLESIMPIYSRW